MTRDDATRSGEGTRASAAATGGTWERALDLLREWDPAWAETCLRMTTNPWQSGVLSRKTVELISIALNAGAAVPHPESARRHIRAALETGASRDEILLVLKLSALRSVRSSAFAGHLLVEELPPSDLEGRRTPAPTPTVDMLRAAGRWDGVWDSFVYLDPEWTEEVIATRVELEKSGVMAPKLFAFLSVAYYASQGHLQPAETRRHIKAAMRAGATWEELIEVLKLCFVQSVQACNFLVPILDEELARR